MNLDNLKQKVDSTLLKVGLHKLIYDVNIEESLNLNADQLRGMSAEECGIQAYRLKQYSLYLQVETNKLLNIIKWANRNISALISKEYNNLGTKYTKFEAKKFILIETNSYAKDLYNQYLEAKIQYVTLKNISMNVSYIAESLLALQQTKRYQK